MAREVLDRKRAEFVALAETAFERMFGLDGQNGLVTFAEREQRACEVTDELARWLMAAHVAQDSVGHAGVGDGCPICHGPVQEASDRSAEAEVRELMTRRGRIAYPRGAVHCPRCRRHFFPPG
jgi:uncharacterized protein YbaR (Trm112 family)